MSFSNRWQRWEYEGWLMAIGVLLVIIALGVMGRLSQSPPANWPHIYPKDRITAEAVAPELPFIMKWSPTIKGR